MKSNLLTKVIIGALLSTGLPIFSATALASDIDVTGTIGWDGKTTSVLSIKVDGQSKNWVQAGEPSLTDVSVTLVGSDKLDFDEVPDPGDFSSYVWCIDPVQVAGNTEYTWDLVALEDAPVPGTTMGTDGAADMRLLFGNVYPADLIDGIDRGIFGSNERVFFDAFQLAIWEISKETSSTYSLSDGSFEATDLRTPAKAIDQAEVWLTALNNDTFDSALIVDNLFALSRDNGDGTVQDFIVAIDAATTGGGSPVPLPAAFWLFGSALIGTAAVARRRRVG